jgi:F-type H+-transporting ATPase subunit delta|tara:strand:- start:14434 stop:14826 length:393 start_codon:yes stop_codon:yes gene_type:complete
MKSGKEATRVAKKLFSVSGVDGKLDLEIVEKVVKKLIADKPRGYLQVISAYWRLVTLNESSNRAVIESAIELDSATKNAVLTDLKKKYGDQIAAEFNLNADLIGGMKIRVGSDVWDGSVKNRIERLSEKF